MTLTPRILLLLCLAALLGEAAQLPVYGAAFGAPVLAVLSVRALLSLALASFAVRGAPAAQVVFGALRLMAGLVGVVMATVVAGHPGLVVALAALGVLDVALGLALIAGRVTRNSR